MSEMTLHEALEVLLRPWWRFVYWVREVLTTACGWAARVLEKVVHRGQEKAGE